MSIEDIKDILKDELIDLAEKLGRSPSQKELSKYNLHGLNSFIKYFQKPYNDILKECNLKVHMIYKVEKTDKELLDDFYNVFVKLGHIPINKEYQSNNIEAVWIYRERFKSIENVCKLLNIDFNIYYKPSTAGIICLDYNRSVCKSIVEKDISNFFILNNILFEKEYKYKNIIKGDKRKFDWKVTINNKTYYIEYAGMYRENPNTSVSYKYSNKIKNKIKSLTECNLIDSCIFVYPDDIKNKTLKEIFDDKFNLNLINLPYSKYNKTVKYNDLSDEKIYDYFLKFYNIYNSANVKTLINYNYSLYAEISRRYNSYYFFLEKYGFEVGFKPKNYWLINMNKLLKQLVLRNIQIAN
jgi:hypothetical protein